MQADRLQPEKSLHMEETVQIAVTGDRKAIDSLINRYQQEIFRMVYLRAGSLMDAEDITQDIFIKVFKRIGRLRNPRLFKSWLYRLAINQVIDYHRKKRLLSYFGFGKKNPSESVEAASHLDPSSDLLRKEFQTRLFSYLKSLSATEREVFLLRFMDGLKIREIAAILEKAESSVKTHLYRSLRKFRGSVSFRSFLREYKNEG